MRIKLGHADLVIARLFLVVGLTAGLVAGCELLRESQTTPPRVDQAVSLPVGDTGTAVVVAGSGQERASTLADDAIDTASTIGGTVTGNPLLWGLLAQGAHLLVGAIVGRKKDTAAPA